MLIFLFALLTLIEISRTYILWQETGMLSPPKVIEISPNRMKMIVGKYDGVSQIYELQNSGQYIPIFSISHAFAPKLIEMSNDETKIVFVSKIENCITIYHENLGSYILSQNLSISQATVGRISEDSQYLIIGSQQFVINVYKIDNNGNYVSYQNLPILSFTKDITIVQNKYIISSGYDFELRIFELINGQFVMINSISNHQQIKNMWVQDDLKIIILTGTNGNYRVYHNNNGLYTLFEEVTTSLTLIQKFYATKKGQRVFYFDLTIYNFQIAQRQTNESYNHLLTIDLLGNCAHDIGFDDSGSVVVVGHIDGFNVYFQCNFYHCLQCATNLSCEICQNGFILQSDGICYEILPDNPNIQQPSEITLNKSICVTEYTDSGFCPQYCDQSCLKCKNYKYNCSQCMPLYKLVEGNKCQLEANEIQIITNIYPIVSTVRHSKVKMIFLFMTDLWMYQYHKPKYTGIVYHFFETIRLIQTKKDEIIGVQKIPIYPKIQGFLRHYDFVANPKYISIERKDDAIPQNITSYILQVVPLTIILFLLIKVLFKLLYNYPISAYLRPLSFNGCIIVSLMEGNIQQFAFLGTRNLQYLFAQTFPEKLYSFLIVLFSFLQVLFVFAGYFLLRYQYRKLYKYFLTNLFRVSGASWLSALIYCIRPFLSGIIHSLLYNDNELQLFLLGLLDFLVFMVMVILQIKIGIHKSKLSFIFFAIYLGCGVPLNILMYFIVVYAESNYMMNILDLGVIIIVFSRGSALLLSILFNILELHTYQKSVKEQIQQLFMDGQTIQAKICQSDNKYRKQVQNKIIEDKDKIQPTMMPQQKQNRHKKGRLPKKHGKNIKNKKNKGRNSATV